MTASARRWSRRAVLSTSLGASASAAFAMSADARQNPARTRRPSANGQLHEIRAGRHRLVIAGVAATVLSWRVDGQEVLLTHDAEEVGESYQGKTILPWPNRIAAGRYVFDGEELQVPVNEPERNAALHGLLSFVEWELVHHERDRVVLDHVLPPQYGYPFSLAFRIEFRVTEDGFHSTLRTRNIGSRPAPFGTANHTFLAAGDGDIDSLVLRLPAGTFYRTDDDLIPTGTAPVGGTEYDFRTARALGGTEMDTAFTELAADDDGVTTVDFRRADGLEFQLWVDEAHRYLQVYTDDGPATDRPARQGITVEPMTCAPNAFVTGDGLVVLAPGETHTGRWGYRLRTPG